MSTHARLHRLVLLLRPQMNPVLRPQMNPVSFSISSLLLNTPFLLLTVYWSNKCVVIDPHDLGSGYDAASVAVGVHLHNPATMNNLPNGGVLTCPSFFLDAQGFAQVWQFRRLLSIVFRFVRPNDEHPPGHHSQLCLISAAFYCCRYCISTIICRKSCSLVSCFSY